MRFFPDCLLIVTCCLKRSNFGAIAALTAREERFRRQLLLLLLLRGRRLRMLRRGWVWAYRLRSNVALQVVRSDFIDAYTIVSNCCI